MLMMCFADCGTSVGRSEELTEAMLMVSLHVYSCCLCLIWGDQGPM